MSAFLGPIHKWLYGKIKFQEELVERILKLAEQQGIVENLREKTDAECGVLESGELEDIIDGSNIHGWLQQRVTIVEKRLAYTVTRMVEEKPEVLEQLCQEAYQCGIERQMSAELSLQEAYQYLDALWLNGMPCDRIHEIKEQSNEKIVWMQTRDIHEEYWQMFSSEVSYFYQLRNSLIQGILQGSGIVCQELPEKTFQLVRA